MSLDKIYQGEDYLKTFSRQVSKVVTPHANISEVEVHLFIDEDLVEKYSATDRTGDGFVRLTTEAEDGKYTFQLSKEKTETLTPGSVVVGEFYFLLTSGQTRTFKQELGVVEKMNA